MTAMIIPMRDGRLFLGQQGSKLMQVMVHIEAEVLDPHVARRRANIWLTMNGGHLLMVNNPELVLGEPLQWRFDVLLSIPQHDQTGSVMQNRIGQISLDALTGEVVSSSDLIEELKANASALIAN
jgi:hypothetical protein